MLILLPALLVCADAGLAGGDFNAAINVAALVAKADNTVAADADVCYAFNDADAAAVAIVVIVVVWGGSSRVCSGRTHA